MQHSLVVLRRVDENYQRKWNSIKSVTTWVMAAEKLYRCIFIIWHFKIYLLLNEIVWNFENICLWHTCSMWCSSKLKILANEEQKVQNLGYIFYKNGFILWLHIFELSTDVSETPCPSNIITENNHKGLSLVRLMAMKALPQILQDSNTTSISLWKCHEESKVVHYYCEVWQDKFTAH